MSTALIDPATMPLPGDEPARPAALPGDDLIPLSQVPALIRERNDLRSTVESQRQTIRELQKVILGDMDADGRERLIARLSRRVDELETDLCDEAFYRARAEQERNLALGLVEGLGAQGGDECSRCKGHGVDLDDLTALHLDDYQRDDDGPSIEEAIEIHQDVNGCDPAPCPSPTCWAGWELGLDVPAELRRED